MKRSEDHAELDALLQSDSQQTVQKVVRSLPEESLSLSWRSELNERLRQIQPVPRWKSRLAVSWKPAVGLALAGCLAITLTLRTMNPTQTHRDNLEASLVSVYDEQATSDEVAGSGLGFHEVNDTTSRNDSTSDWTESDLTNL